MSNDVQQLRHDNDDWVEGIEEILRKGPFPNIPTDIPTGSFQASITDSEEKPSIFCDYPLLVYFGHQYVHEYLNAAERREFRGWQFVAFMSNWFDLDVHSYNKYILEKENLVRGYYHGNVFYGRSRSDRNYFFDYLLINSCILVFSILLFRNVRSGIEILNGSKQKTRDTKVQRCIEFNILYQYIMNDPMQIKLQMLTMGYQIPWFVVEAVYTKHSNLSKLVDTPIDKLAFSCFDNLYPGVHKSKVNGGTGIGTLPPGGFKHLLHIFHWTRTPEGKFLVETRSLQPIEKIGNFYIPSATDLKLSATVFKKHAGIDVSYCDKRFSGVMQIAPFHIFKYSFEIYQNLLRFERGYMDCGFPVTAYVACMMNLSLTKADAKLLRANGIIPSTGNDEDDALRFVQQFKTEISDDVGMPIDLNILSEKVREHHEKSSSRSYAELKSRYFENRWITISVIAGICLFVLTFIQTLYSTLSYYKQ